MFELQSLTYFNDGTNLGHAVVFMNRNKRVSKFEVIFKTNKNREWHFYYENDTDIDRDVQADFEKWLIEYVTGANFVSELDCEFCKSGQKNVAGRKCQACVDKNKFEHAEALCKATCKAENTDSFEDDYSFSDYWEEN